MCMNEVKKKIHVLHTNTHTYTHTHTLENVYLPIFRYNHFILINISFPLLNKTITNFGFTSWHESLHPDFNNNKLLRCKQRGTHSASPTDGVHVEEVHGRSQYGVEHAFVQGLRALHQHIEEEHCPDEPKKYRGCSQTWKHMFCIDPEPQIYTQNMFYLFIQYVSSVSLWTSKHTNEKTKHFILYVKHYTHFLDTRCEHISQRVIWRIKYLPVTLSIGLVYIYVCRRISIVNVYLNDCLCL